MGFAVRAWIAKKKKCAAAAEENPSPSAATAAVVKDNPLPSAASASTPHPPPMQTSNNQAHPGSQKMPRRRVDSVTRNKKPNKYKAPRGTSGGTTTDATTFASQLEKEHKQKILAAVEAQVDQCMMQLQMQQNENVLSFFPACAQESALSRAPEHLEDAVVSFHYDIDDLGGDIEDLS